MRYAQILHLWLWCMWWPSRMLIDNISSCGGSSAFMAVVSISVTWIEREQQVLALNALREHLC